MASSGQLATDRFIRLLAEVGKGVREKGEGDNFPFPLSPFV
ncbi:hypothetical protein [Hydrococcus rivularis]|nr:hypothetical protein [Hydrococcus rivularis]